MAKGKRKVKRNTHHKRRPDHPGQPGQSSVPEIAVTDATIADLRRELFPKFDHDATDEVALAVRDDLDAELARAVQTLKAEGKIKATADTDDYDVARIARLINARHGIGEKVRDNTVRQLANVEAGLADAKARGEAYEMEDGRWIVLTPEWLENLGREDGAELFAIHQELQEAAGRGDQQAANALPMVTDAGQAAGLIRDVKMTVAGDDPELVGAMLDNRTGKLVGAAPNTPASKLSMEEVAERMGVEIEVDPPEFHPSHRITTGDPGMEQVVRQITASPEEQKFRELWPDGEDYDTAVPLYMGTPGVKISYVGLASLSGQLESHDFKCGVEPDTLRTFISPKAMHRIISAWRVQSPEGTVVRAGMMVERRDGTRRPALHDMLPETWEALRGEGPLVPTGAHISTGDAGASFTVMPGADRIYEDDRPVWAGARAFDRVWERLHAWGAFGHRSIETGEDPLELLAKDGWEPGIRYAGEGLIGFSLSGISELADATEVLVEPTQINALPEFDGMAEATDYAERVHLPYDSLFLDMEGPARSCVTVDTGGGSQLIIRGAHVRRLVLGDEESPLAVMPYGSIVGTNGDVDGDQTYNPLGLFLFGVDRPRHAWQLVEDGEGRDVGPGLWGVSNVLDNGFVHRSLIADPLRVRTPMTGGEVVDGMNGPTWNVVVNPDDAGESRCQAHTVISADMEADYQRVAVAVAGLTGGAMAALKALFLMDMSNVELIDGRSAGQVSRQVARQAERKGQTIALAVHVSTSSKRYQQRGGGLEPGAPGSLEYSHRFRVRGHVKHYPIGTRMADADPRKVKPCPRCGNCRRIWTPPFIKGPDDKPLILKSLVLD